MVSIEYINDKVTSGTYKGVSVLVAIQKMAQDHPDEFLMVYQSGINTLEFKKQVKDYLKPHIITSSYHLLDKDFGYIEDSPFIPISNLVAYPTWIKSNSIFTIHASLVNQVKGQLSTATSLTYWINSLSKLARPLGVLCYQLPIRSTNNYNWNVFELYKFVKQHYKARWTLILLLCHICYEKRFPILAFAKAQLYKKRYLNLDVVALQEVGKEDKKIHISTVYDVIIPTMGRREYLRGVMRDLANQTFLPEKVIVVEQCADVDGKSELDYLSREDWPFQVIHEFIHQTGACNARNLAISHVTSPWILFFDDDNEFKASLIETVFNKLFSTGAKVLTLAYLQKNEVEKMIAFKQWESFGSGCSILHKDVVEKCNFDMSLEHGYGEDADYGMQIRKLGYDVIYAPQIQILHLKAPIGGFRKPHVFPWLNDTIQPKPSPQIMYHRKKNYTQHQLKGYKMTLLLKTYGRFGTYFPWVHLSRFQKAWNKSDYWSKQL